MSENENSSILRWLGILAICLICFVLLWFIGVPIVKFGIAVIWWLSSFLGFLFKIIFFIILCVAAILGLIMFISWLIREFTE